MPKSIQREEPLSPVYITLHLPTITSHPSLRCLQWSAEGQVCFVNKSSVIILTPDHGINFDNDSTIASAPNGEENPFGWFKTMIQSEKITPMRWPDYSQAWGAASLGSIDLSVISLATSPIGVAGNGGCVFVTLTSNMDVNLWIAGNNYLKGEWFNTFDVTPFLLRHTDPKDVPSIPSVLRAQTVCIEWTPQADFGVSPHSIDGSLLILGSRGGSLTFMRHRNDLAPNVLETLTVANKWITQIAFSFWIVVAPGHCEGFLAYGISDGAVGLVKVVQRLVDNTANSAFGSQYKIDTTFENDPNLICGSELNSGITAMRWIDVPGRSPILVCSHPGLIKLWSAPESSVLYWTGTRFLRIQTQKISADSSAFHPLSGISYIRTEDCLIITLYDGSFHVIRKFSSDPNWLTRDDKDPVTSEALSLLSRSIFVRTENVREKVDRKDMLRIDGAMLYDDNASFLWTYESARPSDFSYKHEAKHHTTLIVSQMWNNDNDDLLLHNLATLLNTIKTSSGFSPLHLLRPFLVHLRHPTKLDVLHQRFLQILRPQFETDSSIGIRVPPLSSSNELDENTRLRFRQSLSSHLFGWDDLLSLRMRLSLADFAWKLTGSEKNQSEVGVVAQTLLNGISHRVLRTIVRHLFAVIDSLTQKEIPFISRMITQSLLPGSPADLSEEGRQLYALTQPLINSGTTGAVVSSDDILNRLIESCPACGIEVPLQDITTAVCVNGHSWPRCSVTTFILSTPWVRTCVGCGRKAFFPPSAKKYLPEIAQGWVVEDLLEVVHRCLFCNNGFVGIV